MLDFYLQNARKMRFSKRLADDLKSFYLGIGIENLANFAQIQKVLNGNNFDFSVVCQIAFLQIPFADLLSTKKKCPRSNTVPKNKFLIGIPMTKKSLRAQTFVLRSCYPYAANTKRIVFHNGMQ